MRDEGRSKGDEFGGRSDPGCGRGGWTDRVEVGRIGRWTKGSGHFVTPDPARFGIRSPWEGDEITGTGFPS
eukprot:scaffold240_cov369-Pavlova_lutheri.AAC.36